MVHILCMSKGSCWQWWRNPESIWESLDKACLPFSLYTRCHTQNPASSFPAQYKLVLWDLGQAWFLWACPVQTCKVSPPSPSTPLLPPTSIPTVKHTHTPPLPLPCGISSIIKEGWTFYAKATLCTGGYFVTLGWLSLAVLSCNWALPCSIKPQDEHFWSGSF